MEVADGPPVRFAQRISERYFLKPPVDVRAMLERYADVVDAAIPIPGVDGVCLDLKVPGKRPRVVINSSNPPNRVRFTEAHELGHIVIPWHRGTIVDFLDLELVGEKGDYWVFEQEANQFAAELLMPSLWMAKLLTSTKDLSTCHRRVCERCEVSPLAASRRLEPLLPPNIVFVSEKGGKVEFSGRTTGTHASTPAWGSTFDHKSFQYAASHSVSTFGNRELHWWVLPDDITGEAKDARPWREILDAIVEDLNVEVDERPRFKKSVNGVLAAANSAVKQRGSHTTSAVIAACVQRFHDRSDLFGIADHPSFMDFVIKRATELTR